MSTTKDGIGNAIAQTQLGKLGGFGLFLFATVMLFVNEGDYKKGRDAIMEAESVAVHVEDVGVADAEREGLLIHGTAQAQTDEWLNDPLFEVSVNAVKLSRNVRYYQWEEEEETEEYTDSDGETHTTTTYSYYKTWTSLPIDSDKFYYTRGHENHVLLDIKSMEKYAERVQWGAYNLPLFLKSAIDSTLSVTNLALSDALTSEWKGKLAQSVRRQYQREPENDYLTVGDRVIYMGANPDAPAIGDIYLFFSYVPPGLDLSLIAQVTANTFTKYTAKNGRQFYSVHNGVMGLSEMFTKEFASNAANAWAMRFLWFLCIVVALRCMFEWLRKFCARIPVLGSVVHVGIKMICFIMGLSWSILVIAIAWLFYRPVVSLILLGFVLLFVWRLRQRGRKRELKAGAAI